MKTLAPLFKPFARRFAFALALVFLAQTSLPNARGQRYWDSNDSTVGFGTAQGTWATPTTNDATQGWSTSANGTAALSGTTNTTTANGLNFGTASYQLGTGTITVSGNVSAGTIAIVSSSSEITLSGGNITSAGDLTVTNSANTTAVTHTISSNITYSANRAWFVNNGGSTGTAHLDFTGALITIGSLTKAGNGTVTISGTGHSFSSTSALRFSAGILELSGNLTTEGSIDVGTSANNGTFNITGNLTQTRAANATNFRIGEFAANTGTANVSGSANVTLTGLSVGIAGRGTFNQSGGTVTNSGVVNLGGITSTMNVRGGIFDMGSNALTMGAATGANSTLSVNGTGSITMGTLQFSTGSRNATSMTVNLGDGTTGGNLLITGMSYGGGASSGPTTINFNGGTLTANNTFSMITQAATVVKSGGAIINVEPTRTFTIGTALTDGGGGGGLTKNGNGTLTLSGVNTYTGATTINAGTLSIASITNGGVAGPLGNSNNSASNLVLGGGSLLYTGSTASTDRNFTLAASTTSEINVSNAATTLTMSGTSASTNGSLTKNGSGTLVLSGNNGHSGATTINGGTLVLSGTAAGSATVNSGGTIAVGTSANTVGSLTVAGLSLNSGGTFSWDMSNATGAAGTGWDFIDSSGLLTIGATSGSKFTIAIASSGAPANWDYTNSGQTWDIIAYGSLSGFSADKFAFDTSSFAGSLTLDSHWALSDTGSALRLTYTYTASTPTWSGASGNWSTGFTPAITSGSDATFAGVGGTATNNILSGNLTSLGLVLFSGTGAYTLAANSGSAGYDAASALAINSGITNSSTGTQTINLALSLAANQNISATAGDIVIGGTIAGAGGITKDGPNALTLTGNNTYSGGTTLSAGQLNINNANALGTGTLTITGGALDNTSGSTITLSNNAQNWNGDFSFAGTNDLNLGTGAVALNASRAVTISNGILTVGGVVSGSGFGLTKNGTGTLALNGNNTFSGATTINAGTLEIGAAGRLGGGSYAGNIAINGLTSAFVYSGSSNQILSGVISGNGALTKNGNATLTLSGASKTITGNVTINAGTLSVSNGALNTNITVNSGATLTPGANYGIANSQTVTLNGGTLNVGGLFIEPGAIVMNNGTVTGTSAAHVLAQNGWTGTGTNTINQRVSLENSKSGSGLFDIQSGATTINAVVYNYQNRTLGITKNGTGTLLLNGNNTFGGTTTLNAGTLEIGGSGRLGGGTFASNITNNANLIYSGTNDQALSGVISGTGALTQNGTGTLTLSGSNSYSGGTTLNSGTLVIGNTAAAGTATITQTDGSSLLKLDTTGTIANAMSIYNVSANKTVTISGGITVNNATFDVASGEALTISNTINGTGGVTKNGAGNLTLSGSNTYSGATVVNAGTLNAAHVGALGSNNTVTVNGGTLLVTADDALEGKNIEMGGSGIGLRFSGTYNGSIGLLTLSANSTLDLGNDAGGVIARFSDIDFNNYNLSIYNWTGETLWGGTNRNNTDQVYIMAPVDPADLNRISFYSGNYGTDSFLGTGFELGFSSGFADQIIPVPEPETYATGLLLLLGGAWWMWRRQKAA